MGKTEAGPLSPASDNETAEPPRILLATRKTIAKPRTATGRAAVGGRGKFRLLVTPETGERACSILDGLVAAIEQAGWTTENGDQGYSILVDGEAIGFIVEEKLDRVPHVVTAAELEQKVEYDRRCELADWPAADLVDTKIGCFHLSEVHNAKKEVQPRVQA